MNPDYKQFIDGIVRVLVEREGCGILLYIKGPDGLTTLTNAADPADRLAILRIATIVTEEEFKAILSQQRKDGTAQNYVQQINHIAQGKGPGKAN